MSVEDKQSTGSIPGRAVNGTPAQVLNVGNLRELFAEHAAAVHALAVCLCGPRLAREITTSVFASLAQHPDGPEAGAISMRLRLVILAYRASSTTTRTERARRMREDLGDARGPNESKVEDNHHAQTAEQVRVATALSSLNEDEQEALLVTYYGECTYQDAAAAIGVSPTTLKVAIRSGLERLRDALVEVTGDRLLPAGVERRFGRGAEQPSPPRGDARSESLP